MNAALLNKIFGRDQQWHGPCTVLMHGEAAIATQGVDSLLGGGTKQYAPRVISGRIVADAVCLLQDGSALLLIQQQKTKQSTGEEQIKQLLTVADTAFVMGGFGCQRTRDPNHVGQPPRYHSAARFEQEITRTRE